MSVYGAQSGKGAESKEKDCLKGDILPFRTQTKDGNDCFVDLLERGNEEEVARIHQLLATQFKLGTYPQRDPPSRDDFMNYYCSNTVLVCRNADGQAMGSVYIKPNFPGRCDHLCNGGFLVHPEHRSKGVARILANAFEKCAAALGYRAAIFNLVFVDNPYSISLWQSLGYEQIGRIPDAKRTEDGQFVDALMFYKRFQS